MSSLIKRKEFILGIVIVIAIFIYVPYFIEVPEPVHQVESWLTTTTVIIASLALWVGVYTMTRRQLLRYRRKLRGWWYGAWMIGLLLVMLVLGIITGTSSRSFRFFADSFVVPGDATIYAILVFYLTSSAARAFKIRDLESLLLGITAVLVFLKQAPMGEYFFPYIGPVGQWLTNYLAMAATRVFAISAALGGIVLAVRLYAGKEMGMLGMVRGREEE